MGFWNPAKPGACGHVPGKPRAESGPSADALDTAKDWGGRLRVESGCPAAECPHLKQMRSLPAAPAQRGPSLCPEWLGSLPWCPVLSAATSLPVFCQNPVFTSRCQGCWVELCAQGGGVGVCVSVPNVWVSTALCFAPSDCSVAQGRGRGTLRSPRSSCLVVL